ncbi:MAG: N-acetylmuramoyl-L-alanine amidase [Bradyrhizobium sp.]
MASRAGHRLLLECALLCAAVLFWSDVASVRAGELASQAAPGFPVASQARLAGDAKQTRFVLDLDQPIKFHTFTLADPYRLVVDIPQVNFRLPAGTGTTGRGLVKAFRYGLVMPGGSRIVFDLTGPARVADAYVLDAAKGQPSRLVLDFEEVDRTTFMQALAAEAHPEVKPTAGVAPIAIAAPETIPAIKPAASPDLRPVVVIDPGHGGVDSGTRWGDVMEKDIVLAFGLALRDRLEKNGKYRVVMTRSNDTFVSLDDRVRIARKLSAALFISLHANYLAHSEGEAQGATIYTESSKASDAAAQKLADEENRADAIGGVNLTEQPADVANILMDLAQREIRTFSSRFARILVSNMKNVATMHDPPIESAGFRVLKDPDVPSVLVELGFVSNKRDLGHLVSQKWRKRAVAAMAQAIDAFLAKRLTSSASAN